MNTRKVVLTFIINSHSHLRNVSSRFRVKSTAKKHGKTISSEQTIFNLVYPHLRLK